MVWQTIANHIGQVTGQAFGVQSRRSISGGCINQGYCLQGGGRSYFVKLNRASQLPMFEAEALGLMAIANTQTVRVPQPLASGQGDSQSYLILEWLEFGPSSAQAWGEMGRNLARLHQQGRAQQYGWTQDNTIGLTPQPNPWTEDWGEFWLESRLGYQLRLARRRGGDFPDPWDIAPGIKNLLAGHQPPPSLVHGDLWSGNVAILATGEPVILDPAPYYGDAEVDLAMTELFGGFPAAFYRGYGEILPPQPGYEQRKILYNLYHVLNHFNLFGGGYGQQARQMLRELGLAGNIK